MTAYISIALAAFTMPFMSLANTPQGQTQPGQVIIVRPGAPAQANTPVPFAGAVPASTVSMLSGVFGKGSVANDAVVVFGPFVSKANEASMKALLSKVVNDPTMGQEVRESIAELANQIRSAQTGFSRAKAASPSELAALLREVGLDMALVIAGPGMQGTPDLFRALAVLF